MNDAELQLDFLWGYRSNDELHDLLEGLALVDALVVSGMLDAAQAGRWRSRLQRAIDGPLAWPPPDPQSRERALALLEACDDEDAEDVIEAFVNMNVITPGDALQLYGRMNSAWRWPAPQDATTIHGVALGPPTEIDGLRVVWLARLDDALLVAWRATAQSVEITELCLLDGVNSTFTQTERFFCDPATTGSFGHVAFIPAPLEAVLTLIYHGNELRLDRP
jgi:hypothetical protein